MTLLKLTELLCLYALLALIVIGPFFLRAIKDSQRAIILRSGQIHRIAGPGWAFALRFYEKVITLEAKDLATIAEVRNLYQASAQSPFNQAFFGLKIDDERVAQKIQELISAKRI